MPVYLCRWPYGDFSIVSAANREMVDRLLDEVGNPDKARITMLRNAAVHFKFTKPNVDNEYFPFILDSLGQQTSSEVLKKAYPIYNAALRTPEADLEMEDLQVAFESEKARLQHLDQSALSDDPDADVARLVTSGYDFPVRVAKSAVKAFRGKTIHAVPRKRK